MSLKYGLLGAALGLALAAGAPAADPKTQAAAKTVLAKYQAALGQVRVALTDREIAGGLETQFEMSGTVITPEGLTVVSNWESLNRPFFDDQYEERKVNDVTLVLKDGTEVPAQFVLRDKDLDLAFIRPLEKGLKLAHVSVAKTPGPAVLDDVRVLYRLGKAFKREPAVALAQVEAVTQKPRTFVVTNYRNSYTAPVFDTSARFVGLNVIRRLPVSRGNPNAPVEE